ncbi:MAG: hypothetical protein DDT24_00794 [Chloroflexi bacterium]|nr:hypothetical protein [Chloroflexota bacterium]
MPSLIQCHAQYGIAIVNQCHIGRHIGYCAAIWLDISVLSGEEFLCSMKGYLLHLIGILAATVVAFAGISLGVFIGQHRSLSFENSLTGVVLGSNKVNAATLSFLLLYNDACYLGVDLD